MSDQDPAPSPLSRVLGKDYWLIMSAPVPGTSQAAIDARVDEHVRWLLELEADGRLFLSGPLLSGPGTGPGSGVTVIRAVDREQAQSIAERDPFVVAGLRTFTAYQWRLNEGNVGIQISLGTGTYHWQ